MMSSNHVLSTLDFARLMPLVTGAAERAAQDVVDQLDEKLASAKLVAPETMSPDVVTMNSKVVLSSPVWEAPREYRLVYPRERTGDPGQVSVLSALGAELLGARIGARLELGSGPTFRRVELSALTYQPEAAGDWDR